MGEDEMRAVLRFFKALADASRLRLVGLLAGAEHSVDELATLLDLRAPTVSHHLARLREAGLVTMRQDGTTHYYRLDGEALQRLSRDVLTPERVRALAGDLEPDPDAPSGAWERKVLRDFFADGRLKEIPAQRKKRLVILRWLAERFQPGVRYAEREVNEILGRYHPDTATLRRELIADAHALLRRERGVYWRLEGPDAAPAAAS